MLHCCRRVLALPTFALQRMPFAKVFVINLARRPERFSFIEEQLEKAGICGECVERVDAVDGGGLSSAEELRNQGVLSPLGYLRYTADQSQQIWGMDLTCGAVGCAMSHLKTWNRIAMLEAEAALSELRVTDHPTTTVSGSSCYLVVEDDSVLSSRFLDDYMEVMNDFQSCPTLSAEDREWELLYVAGLDTGHQCADLTLPYPSVSKHRVCRVPQLHRTTNAYVVTAKGAATLSQVCFPLTFQLDTEMTSRVKPWGGGGGGVAAVRHHNPEAACVHDPPSLTIQPPLVYQHTRFSSDIQSEKRGAATSG